MFETIEISSTHVACDGGNGPLGHPRVYLHTLPENHNSVTCGYCSRTYVYNPHKADVA